MKIEKIAKPKVVIPTASMADIAFLLIIFFMLTTVFRKERGLKVIQFPQAEQTQRIKKHKHLAYIWISSNGDIFVHDLPVDTSYIEKEFRRLMFEDPQLLTMIMADKRVKYKYVNMVTESLREAKALRISFRTDFEKK
ncbi:MAG: biopolymer transporter ExbD [Candidatus Hydrothermales bacterium]